MAKTGTEVRKAVFRECTTTVDRFHSKDPVSERKLIPCQMPIVDPEKYRKVMDSLLSNATSEKDREDVRKFVGVSPFKLGELESWDEERVPRALQHMIKSAADEYIFRMQTFLDIVDDSFFKSVPDYLSDKFAQKEFKGVVVNVDQSNSSAGQHGADPQTIKKTTDIMHLYFRVTMAVFRLYRDVLVGDAISLAGKAPEDNQNVAAVEAARFLLTMQTLFTIHNKMVDMSPSGQYSHIMIRGAAGSGQVGINDNPIQPTVICDLMNFVARIAGYLPEMGVLVNDEAGESIKNVFKLREIKVGKNILNEVERVKKESEAMWRRRNKLSPEELVSLCERYYALSRKLDILHITYERKNMKDPQRTNGETEEQFASRQAEFWAKNKKKFLKEYTFLAQKADYLQKFSTISGLMYTNMGDEKAGEAITEIKLGVEFALGAQEYIQMLGKFKGFKYEDIGSLWEILGYSTAREDKLAFHEKSGFRIAYLGDESRGRNKAKSKLEEFVEDTAEQRGIAVKTDFNPDAAYYMMYTMQLTGAPDFAFLSAVRAAGMAIYLVNTISENRRAWASEEPKDGQHAQPNAKLAEYEEVLMKNGILGADGGRNEERYKKFVQDRIIMPTLLREIGILGLYNEINKDALAGAKVERDAELAALAEMFGKVKRFEKAIGRESKVRDIILAMTNQTSVLDDKSAQLGATGSLLAKPFSEFTSQEELLAREYILAMNELSAAMMERLNKKFGPGTFEEETIAVVKRLSFGKAKNGTHLVPEPSLEGLAADIIKPSFVEQEGIKPKAHKRRKEPFKLYTRRALLKQIESFEANVLGAMDDLIYLPMSA